jgi:hypothetical protein
VSHNHILHPILAIDVAVQSSAAVPIPCGNPGRFCTAAGNQYSRATPQVESAISASGKRAITYADVSAPGELEASHLVGGVGLVAVKLEILDFEVSSIDKPQHIPTTFTALDDRGPRPAQDTMRDLQLEIGKVVRPTLELNHTTTRRHDGSASVRQRLIVVRAVREWHLIDHSGVRKIRSFNRNSPRRFFTP